MPKERPTMKSTTANQHLPKIALLAEGGRILPALTSTRETLLRAPNEMFLSTAQGDGQLYLSRHPNEFNMQHFPTETGSWVGTEYRKDTTGCTWRRTVRFVAGDYADLVEVTP